ncbi:XapX domain-containing protein [Lysobacter sp. A6]|uniref:XapX domain-containing protein n=1 Tax=Noviluteimonas lactosilytica TaxID=2888523 RepID=A0ABS8JJD5_9GAMM|nr:XapX domain-containing protein [Lysobacter lactosilyticus]MCC8363701.1 XapX domain-containing protein [Lysobacter lactosilyticus]
MMLAITGVVMALLVGVVCRVLDLPLPAPPRLQGAWLVVAMTLGFIAAARVLE